MLTMALSQHLSLHWLSLQIEATHTQDGGYERDSRDQTCSLVFVGSVDLVLISRMLVFSPVYIRQKRRDLEQIATEGFLGSS